MSLGLGLGLSMRSRIPLRDPLRILGDKLVGWWRADVGVTQSGGVSEWSDVVGGYLLAQATSANQPTYSATSFNGRPGISFDGTDDFLRLEGVPASFPDAAEAGEIWALVDQQALAADTGSRIIAAYGGAGASENRFLRRTVVSAQNRVAAGIHNTAISGPASDFSGRKIARLSFDGTTGTAYLGSSAGTGATITGSTTTTRITIGAANTTTPSSYFQGIVAQVFVVAGTCTDDEAAALRAYLAT